ncbi:MAG: hypothetical protein JKY98_11120, partial [Gammaproteobacteria bacterium]|nr:hypothetical protein [Gammaproteobacteria bacterium]
MKKFPDGLSQFQAMYMISLVFGIEIIASALYTSIRKGELTELYSVDLVVSLCAFTSVLLLIVRFFWATGNIRSAWNKLQNTSTPKPEWVVMVHLPVLLVQGVLILFVCMAYAEYMKEGIERAGLWFVGLYIFATFWNFCWLVALQRSSGKPRNYERVWLVNNAVLVTFGIGLIMMQQVDFLTLQVMMVLFVGISIVSSGADLRLT